MTAEELDDTVADIISAAAVKLHAQRSVVGATVNPTRWWRLCQGQAGLRSLVSVADALKADVRITITPRTKETE